MKPLGKGLTVKETQNIINDFLDEYNGNIAVKPIVKLHQEDIYGAQNSKEKLGFPLEGGYHANRGIITLVASNLDNEEAARRTIRHETLGHYGLNTFKPAQKKALLTSVLETQQEPTLKKIWNKVNTHYSDKTPLEKAEEVFAFVAEDKQTFISKAWDSVRTTFQKALRETGLSNRPLTIFELRNEAKAIAEGIKNGTRVQQTFPASDNVQFRRKDKDMASKKRKPFHEEVAEKLIKQLEQGTAPWQKPWVPGNPNTHLPVNPTTGKRYKGINAIQLMSEGRNDPRWLTYKQSSEQGAQVRKGEKGTSIQFWKFSEEQIKKDDKTGKPVLDNDGKPIKVTVKLERPRVFFATVFNAEQIDGLPEIKKVEKKEQQWSAVERAEKILSASGAKIEHVNGDRAFYNSSKDFIQLPEKTQFEASDKYYATALHELGHWTGHQSRLDRDLAHPFGSEGYAKEELRAEISSMILGDELGIGHDAGQHAAYVDSWIKALKEDPLEIFRACSDAEKIQDFVLSLEQKQIQSDEIMQDQVNEQQAIIERLENSSQTAIEGYNSLESWNNLQKTASKNGLIATLHIREVKEEYETDIEIRYSKDGQNLPITTELFAADGKALTSINGERVSGTSYTSDHEWQTDSLLRAVDVALQDIKVEVEQQAINDISTALHLMKTGESQQKNVDELLKSELGAGIQAFNNWTGEVEVRGCVEIEVDDEKQVNESSIDEADFFAVYLQQEDGRKMWLSDHASQLEATNLADKLEAVNGELLVKEKQAKEFKMVNQEVYKTSIENRNSNSSEKVYLNVPYKEKDEAKEVGAKWDRQKQLWFVNSNTDQELVKKWLSSDNTQSIKTPKDKIEKLFLAVPYEQRAVAKSAGAKWDKKAKSWFADEKADMAKLEQFLPTNTVNEQAPAMPPQEEFAAALRDIGAIVDGEHPVMDGKKHRISCSGDKKGEKSVFYVGHLDGRPAGYMVNNRTGEEIKWKSKGYELSSEDKAQLQAEAAQKLQKREQAQKETYERTSEFLTEFFNKALPTTEHEYLQKKEINSDELRIVPEKIEGLSNDSPIKIGKDYRESKAIREANPEAVIFTAGELLLPAQDENNKIWSLQAIQKNGSKRFAKDGKKEGSFHPIGGMKALDLAPVIIIGEGYATAKDLSETAKMGTVAAFDSGNLDKVAKTMRERYPDKPILIAGDDDKKLESSQKVNVGRVKAEAAAKAIKAEVFFPIFAPGEAESGLTDFNDLKQKSLLGKDGLERQVKSAISQTLNKHQEIKKVRREQHQTIEQPKKAVRSR